MSKRSRDQVDPKCNLICEISKGLETEYDIKVMDLEILLNLKYENVWETQIRSKIYDCYSNGKFELGLEGRVFGNAMLFSKKALRRKYIVCRRDNGEFIQPLYCFTMYLWKKCICNETCCEKPDKCILTDEKIEIDEEIHFVFEDRSNKLYWFKWYFFVFLFINTIT